MTEQFKKLSNTISIGIQDQRKVLVNDEWTFIIPAGIEYIVDSEFDGGIQGAISLSGSVKPLVLKGLKKNSEYLFNFALERHTDLLGNFYTIVDCKYDNRIANKNSAASQIIITEKEDFFVDLISVPMFPFGTELEIRVRGSKIEPFNFSAIDKWMDDADFEKVASVMKEIANTICLKNTSASASKKASTRGKAMNDSNCIIEETVLKKYIGKSRDVVLPKGITAIADNTFSGSNIRSITVPEGVTAIGRRVFENCFELEEAYLPSSLKSLGWYGFVDCHKLKKITFSNSLTIIEGSMFSECFELENIVIPETVEVIESFAFKNCRKFTSIVIPNGVKTIGISAFSYCNSLTYLYIPASVTEIREPIIGDATPFDGCDQLTIHCPQGSTAEDYCKSHGIRYVVDDNPITVNTKITTAKTTAGKRAKTKTSAEAATAGDSTERKKKPGRKYYDVDDDLRLVRYKGNAYYKSSLEIPKDVVTIGRGAFVGDEDVCIVDVPPSVTLIESGAFQDLPKLIAVIIPDNPITIENNAFINCPSFHVDTFSGSPTEEYCKTNNIPVVIDDLCVNHYPAIAKKRAKEEQKRIEEENRLKNIASTIMQDLEAVYKDTLDESQYDAVKKAAAATLADACNKRTWRDLYKSRISSLPGNLKETSAKLLSAASAEEAYDSLPGWIASEYISIAETKRSRLTALLSKKNADLDSIRLEEEHLKEERAHLGLFQGKRKREIAALLEAIPDRIKQVNEDYEHAKSQL